MIKKERRILLALISILAIILVAFYMKVGGLILGKEKIDIERMGYCFDVATDPEGKRLFVVAGYRGVHVFNLEHGKLHYAMSYYDGGYYRNLKIWNHRIYLADLRRGLVVLDIREKTPVPSWVQPSGAAYGIHVDNNRAYIASKDKGLEIFDISNPEAPIPLGNFQMQGNAWDVWVEDTLAYIADFDHGVRVVDVSTPEKPRQVGFVTWTRRYPTAEIIRGEENTLYVAASRHGLIIIDITEPVHPVIASIYRPFRIGKAEGLAVKNGIVYLAFGSRFLKTPTTENGLHIIDATDPHEISLISKVSFRGWVEGVHVADGFAFVANTYHGVRVVNIRNLKKPLLVDSFTKFPRSGDHRSSPEKGRESGKKRSSGWEK